MFLMNDSTGQAAFGLGNELNGYISPETWAADEVTMYQIIQDTFGKAAAESGGKIPHPQASRLKDLFSRDSGDDDDDSDGGSTGRVSGGSVPFTYGPCNGVVCSKFEAPNHGTSRYALV